MHVRIEYDYKTIILSFLSVARLVGVAIIVQSVQNELAVVRLTTPQSLTFIFLISEWLLYCSQ